MIKFSQLAIDIFCLIFFLIFLLSFTSKAIIKRLRAISNLIYLSGILYVIYVGYINQFNKESFFVLLLVFSFFNFTLSSTKMFWRFNGIVCLTILAFLYALDFTIEIPIVLLLSALLVIASGGFALTSARKFRRKKTKEREQLLNHIFNNSLDGLIILNNENFKIIESNGIAANIFDGNKESIKGENIQDLTIEGEKLFHDLLEKDKVTKELNNGNIISYRKKGIDYINSSFWLIELTSYEDKAELNISLEFEKLKEYQEQSYTSLFKDSASIICLIDENNLIVDVNTTVSKLLKRPMNDIIGKRFDEFDYEPPKFDRDRINKLAWEGKTQTFEKSIEDTEGNKIEIEVILKKGNYFGKEVLISNSRNITKRKKLEKEAFNIYRNYSTLFRESTVGLVVSDLSGKIIEINNSFEKLLGYSKKELLEMNVKDISNPDDMELNMDLRSKLLNGKSQTLEMEKRYVSKTGKEITTLLKVVLQKNEKNVPINFLAQIIDISDRKEIEEQLKLSEKSYRDVFSNSRELLYILNKNNKFIDVSNSVLERYGYREDEIVNKQPKFLAAEGKNDFKLLEEKLDNAWKGKDEKLFWWSKTKSNAIFPKELYLRKGEYFGKEVLMASGRDISERLEYEKELEKERKKYQELIDSSILGIAILQKGKIVFVNKRACQILKAKKEADLLGRERIDFVRKKDIPIFQERVKKLKEGERCTIEGVLNSKHKGRRVIS